MLCNELKCLDFYDCAFSSGKLNFEFLVTFLGKQETFCSIKKM